MNAVRDCMKRAKAPRKDEVEQLAEKKAAVDRALEQALERKKNLFGFEKGVAVVIAKKADELRKESVRLAKLSQFGSFSMLDLEPFAWRNKQGLPMLVMLSLDSPVCELSVSRSREYRGYRDDYWPSTRRASSDSDYAYKRRCTPNFPASVRQCYMDVLTMLMAIAKKEKRTVSRRVEFTGMIPEPTRGKLSQVKRIFKKFFIITEVREWNVGVKREKLTPQQMQDAMLVGYDGENFWIVDFFTAVAIENFFSGEIATNR